MHRHLLLSCISCLTTLGLWRRWINFLVTVTSGVVGRVRISSSLPCPKRLSKQNTQSLVKYCFITVILNWWTQYRTTSEKNIVVNCNCMSTIFIQIFKWKIKLSKLFHHNKTLILFRAANSRLLQDWSFNATCSGVFNHLSKDIASIFHRCSHYMIIINVIAIEWLLILPK